MIDWIKRIFSWLFWKRKENVTVTEFKPESVIRKPSSVPEPKAVFIGTGPEYHPRREKYKGYKREARHCSFNKRRKAK